MHFSINADWARFKRRGIAMLGRAGFAEWLQHAADVVRAEAKREAINASYAESLRTRINNGLSVNATNHNSRRNS